MGEGGGISVRAGYWGEGAVKGTVSYGPSRRVGGNDIASVEEAESLCLAVHVITPATFLKPFVLYFLIRWELIPIKLRLGVLQLKNPPTLPHART